MKMQIPYLRLAVSSTLSLLLSVFILQVYRWLLLVLGFAFSGFQGSLQWVGVDIVPKAESWTKAEVLWIYLLPYAGLVLLFGLLSTRTSALSPLPRSLRLIWSWLTLLTMLQLLFMPMWEIYLHQGIYFPLIYLFVPRYIQGMLGLILWGAMIFRIFRPAPLFSTLMFGDAPYHNFRQNLKQQIPLLLIPYILYVFLWWFASDFVFTPLNQLFLGGFLLVLVANAWLMSQYKVVVTYTPKSKHEVSSEL